MGAPAVDIVRLLWLQARDNVLQDWEKYVLNRLNGSMPSINTVHSRLITLFNEMEAYFERTLPQEDEPNNYSFQTLYNLIYSDNLTFENAKQLIKFFNAKLDKVNLIKVDTKTRIDKTSIAKSNESMGL